MKTVFFPYGKEHIEYNFKDDELLAVLDSNINNYKPEKGAENLVISAMESPVDSPKLSVLSKGKKTCNKSGRYLREANRCGLSSRQQESTLYGVLSFSYPCSL